MHKIKKQKNKANAHMKWVLEKNTIKEVQKAPEEPPQMEQ